MNYTKLIAFVFFFCGIYSCEGNSQEDSKVIIERQSTIDMDSVPFHLLPKKEQLNRSQPYIKYKDIRLVRNGQYPISYFFNNSEIGLSVQENYPGVISFIYSQNKNSNSNFEIDDKIEFYNPHNDKILKTISLEENSPYNQRNIEKGYLDMEYFEEDSCYFDPNFKVNAEGFSTVNEVLQLPTGHVIIQYQLIPYKGRQIIGWEETIVIYNHKGVEIKRVVMPNSITGMWVAEDDNMVALVGAIPYENESEYFRIYDLDSWELIYEQHSLENETFRGIWFIENGYLQLMNYFKDRERIILNFFDLKNRIRFFKEFKESEAREAFKDFTNYPSILNRVKFNKEKF